MWTCVLITWNISVLAFLFRRIQSPIWPHPVNLIRMDFYVFFLCVCWQVNQILGASRFGVLQILAVATCWTFWSQRTWTNAAWDGPPCHHENGRTVPRKSTPSLFQQFLFFSLTGTGSWEERHLHALHCFSELEGMAQGAFPQGWQHGCNALER